jgi:hypothetical protein
VAVWAYLKLEAGWSSLLGGRQLRPETDTHEEIRQGIVRGIADRNKTPRRANPTALLKLALHVAEEGNVLKI